MVLIICHFPINVFVLSISGYGYFGEKGQFQRKYGIEAWFQ